MRALKGSSKPRAAMDLRRMWRGFGVGIALIMGAAFTAAALWAPVSHVATGSSEEYPELLPRDYRLSQERVFSAAVETVEQLERFELSAEQDNPWRLLANAAGTVPQLDATVSVEVRHNGGGGAVVFMESRLLRGRADFGQGARNIRALQAAMDENLGMR